MYQQPGKNLLNSNISSTCLHNMANFGPLAAEICWRVWGTPANFNGFRVLAALLGTLVVGVSKTLWVALNRGHHLYLAGEPSRWALAHISSLLWSPYVIGQTIMFLPCDFYLLSFYLFYSSPNLSGHRLDVYHTSAHGVALARI